MYDELVKRLKNCATQAAPCLTCDMTDDGSCIETLMKQAADAIEELTKESERWQAEAKDWYLAYMGLLPTRWIPVTERLPEPYKWVLGTAEECEAAFDVFYDGAQWKDAVLNGFIVTHWMPLPQPPKAEEGE